jgi:hypothetical protein
VQADKRFEYTVPVGRRNADPPVADPEASGFITSFAIDPYLRTLALTDEFDCVADEVDHDVHERWTMCEDFAEWFFNYSVRFVFREIRSEVSDSFIERQAQGHGLERELLAAEVGVPRYGVPAGLNLE